MAGSKNMLGRLTDVLFEELERLNSIDASDTEALDAEVKRSRAIQGVAREVNASAVTVMSQARLVAEHGKYAPDTKLLGE